MQALYAMRAALESLIAFLLTSPRQPPMSCLNRWLEWLHHDGTWIFRYHLYGMRSDWRATSLVHLPARSNGLHLRSMAVYFPSTLQYHLGEHPFVETSRILHSISAHSVPRPGDVLKTVKYNGTQCYPEDLLDKEMLTSTSVRMKRREIRFELVSHRRL